MADTADTTGLKLLVSKENRVLCRELKILRHREGHNSEDHKNSTPSEDYKNIDARKIKVFSKNTEDYKNSSPPKICIWEDSSEYYNFCTASKVSVTDSEDSKTSSSDDSKNSSSSFDDSKTSSSEDSNNILVFDSDCHPAPYLQFIAKMRRVRKVILGTKAIEKGSVQRVSHQPLQDFPLNWMYIRIFSHPFSIWGRGSGRASITLKIDPRNLYLHSVFIDDDDDDDNNNNNSNNIFHGADSDDPREIFPPHVIHTSLPTIPLGHYPLQCAIYTLRRIVNKDIDSDEDSYYPETDSEMVISAFNVLNQMFIEACRIQLIADHVFDSWWEPNSIRPRMKAIWQALKRGTLFDVVQSRVTESSVLYPFIKKYGIVDYVILKNTGGKDSVAIYGNVTGIDSDKKRIILYDRKFHESEIKRQGQRISLTSPATFFPADGPFHIKVNLPEGKEEFVINHVPVDPDHFSCPYDGYDNKREQVVYGENGKVCVGYSVLRFAFLATIDVVMISINPKKEKSATSGSSTAVHGQIEASYKLASLQKTSMMLFDKSADECAEVSEQQSIPLTRPSFPVPALYGKLLIRVKLLEGEQEMVSDKVKFKSLFGTQVKKIAGDWGELQVSLTCQ